DYYCCSYAGIYAWVF
nr:immunoglobulin light chain junction region [Macaca mulatta]MOW58533.1 immunoglobulin light chain junction region [Macaca mulatta]